MFKHLLQPSCLRTTVEQNCTSSSKSVDCKMETATLGNICESQMWRTSQSCFLAGTESSNLTLAGSTGCKVQCLL